MTPIYRRIGQGNCGTVWTAVSGFDAFISIKREDGGTGRSLKNDYNMHTQILHCLSSHHPRVQIPKCLEYVPSENEIWWTRQLPRFPNGFQVPCNALVTERIPPFSAMIRDRIIETFCPESLRASIESIKSSLPNKDCLIRPYLGRRRRLEKQSKLSSFSLRNYPLHADQIEELQLDTKLYARIIAATLADLYWRANVYANDVEFVLAPAKEDHSPSIIVSDTIGEHILWILDFDCCRRMEMDEEGVKQAVSAFYGNDPYYPRPRRENPQDRVLWEEFKTQFLESSAAIVKENDIDPALPTLWVHLAEAH
ncbi:hypothetical protein ACLMJK_004557 [Lecanora helva]